MRVFVTGGTGCCMSAAISETLASQDLMTAPRTRAPAH
jgi:hypothetical protein